jgi:hypothetical protein
LNCRGFIFLGEKYVPNQEKEKGQRQEEGCTKEEVSYEHRPESYESAEQSVFRKVRPLVVVLLNAERLKGLCAKQIVLQ